MKTLFDTYRAALLGSVLFLLPPLASRAADEASSVVVVFNTRMPASKEVADHYAEVRKIPGQQLVGLELPEGEAMTRSEFRFRLQEPLFKKFKDEGWFKTRIDTTGDKLAEKVVQSSIRYLVLCYGVPVRIEPEATLEEPGTAKFSNEYRRNEAAVDSELVWLPVLGTRPLLSGPMPNTFFFGQTNAAAFNPTNGILLTARLDGPTPDIAKALVDRALSAETNGLWGRFYFDARGIKEGTYKPGDDAIESGAAVARQLGMPVVLDTRPATFATNFPMSEIAFYAGWYDANVSGPFTADAVDFMPGAFAYHLHSFSAATLRTTTQHWVGPLLAKGATATVGYVYEPYLGGTLDVGVFTARFVHEGFSFGEAAWAASPALSWQTTVVGDPLYRPYALNAQQLHERLARRHDPLIEWSHLRVVDLNLVLGIRPAELARYLEDLPDTASSAVLLEKLGELYGALGKPSSAILTYRRALEKATHRPQRVRLSMALIDRLLAADRQQEAWTAMEKFENDFPEYRNQLQLFQQMLGAAEKLKKEAEAGHLRERIKDLENPPSPAPK